MKITPANFKKYTTFILVLTGIGFIVAWLLHQTFALLGLEISWWLETPGAIVIAGVLFSLYDKYFWTWRAFTLLGIIDFPNLQGRWKGEVVSSHYKKPWPAFLEVKQTASDIVINLYTEQSHSFSIDASFIKSSEGSCVLRYGYENHPNVFSVETMRIHFGSAKLNHYPDIEELRGEYFTSQERVTHGTMVFKFEAKLLRRRFD